MIKIEATNKTDHVDIEMNINGRGDEIAEEMEGIVVELFRWMLNESKPMFTDHLARLVAKGLGLMMEGYDVHTAIESKKEGAN